MMRSLAFLLLSFLVGLSISNGFSLSSSFTGSNVATRVGNDASGLTMEYIPSGMSKEQWKKLKEAEKNKNKGKNLGYTGITSFKSRSFADWQKSGGKNLFPVDPTKVKNQKEIPYMQRPGGSADDSDIGKKKGGFSLGGKKKQEKKDSAPEAPKKNWWTL